MEKIMDWLTMALDYLVANILPALLIILAGIIVIRVVMKLFGKLLEKSKLEKAASNLIKTVLRVVLYGLLALMVADKVGIDVTGVVALASVLTLAVSLSVQNALTNLMGGFTLLYTKPFVAGDFVEVAGQSGVVQSIGLTYTKLTTGDNKEVSIPNSSVVSAEIVNYTATGSRRVDIIVSASYDAPMDLVLEALREAGQLPTTLEGRAPFAAVKNYGESAIEYVLQIWCKSDDYWTTLFEGNKRVKEVFDAKGISMTYPHIIFQKLPPRFCGYCHKTGVNCFRTAKSRQDLTVTTNKPNLYIFCQVYRRCDAKTAGMDIPRKKEAYRLKTVRFFIIRGNG